MHVARGGPLVDTPNLADLLQRDGVKLEVVPEKKGILFLKHVEYKLFSKHYKLPVIRRYSDFSVLHTLLLQKFIYRMVPPLPSKHVLKQILNSTCERDCVEGRCRALQRFMTLVIRHPILSVDELVKVFMTASSVDVQVKLREVFKRAGDEYMTCPLATHVKGYIPDDIQSQAEASREFICNMHSSFQKLRDVTERMSQRTRENSADLLMFGKDLRALGSDASQPPQVAILHPSWKEHRQSLHGLSEEFRVLADKAVIQGAREEEDVVEKLSIFLDLLQSYKDLCDRHKNGIFLEHQRSLQRRRAEPLTDLLENPESRLRQVSHFSIVLTFKKCMNQLLCYLSVFSLLPNSSFTARERYSHHGAEELLLLVLSASRNTADLDLPALDHQHPSSIYPVSDPRTPRVCSHDSEG
ncbi:sorting nexin-8 isoform X3 [Denticeps clupeoides]|uniref:sorting nexin-8 isoform X3 n=1 Tax=Denticeps clupeoides TaxID=299321 RepID=UPI0010A48B8A|nr:sorting nexin-8-like isoform X3 [Denticeps clupeoides]